MILFSYHIENVLEQMRTRFDLHVLLRRNKESWCGQRILPPVGGYVYDLILMENISKYFVPISQYIMHPKPETILSTQYILIIRCSNVIDNSTHITTSIIKISSGSIRIDGYCSDIMTFQYHIDYILGEVLVRPHRCSTHILPSTTGFTVLNYSH